MNELKTSLKKMIEIIDSIATIIPALKNDETYLKAKELVSNEVKSGVCPNCGEKENIEYGDIEIEGELCFQICNCQKCKTEFDDVFEFSGQRIVDCPQ